MRLNMRFALTLAGSILACGLVFAEETYSSKLQFYPPPHHHDDHSYPPRGFFQCTLVASGYSFDGRGDNEYEAKKEAFQSCYRAAERWGREKECWSGTYYCDYYR